MFSPDEIQIIRKHLSEDVNRLALSGLPLTLVTQIAGRQKMREKVPSWYENDHLLYPGKLALEQASSEATARYKSTLIQGHSLADLTGGLGIDTAFLSPGFEQVYYVERQPELAEIARNNFPILGLKQIRVFNRDSIDFLREMESVDCLFIDPARRASSGRKVMRIEDCEPNLLEIQELLREKSRQVLIKLSPMLDIKSALNTLEQISQVHVVSVDNECKELLFWMDSSFSGEPEIRAVNLSISGTILQRNTFFYSKEKETTTAYASNILSYLYEPNASILKAGYYKGLAEEYLLEKLHPDSHLYTSDRLIPDFPGRIFSVDPKGISTLNKKELKAFLLNTEKANITVRNFPLKAEELRRKLKLKDGGEIYIFGTTLADGQHILISGRKIETKKSTKSISPFSNHLKNAIFGEGKEAVPSP